MAKIKGVVSSVVWAKEDTDRFFIAFGYEAGEKMVEGRGWVTTPVRPEAGDFFSASGDWVSAEFRGRKEDQFRAKTYRPDMPSTLAGLERFLVTNFAGERFGISADVLRNFVTMHGDRALPSLMARPGILASQARSRASELIDMWAAKTRVGQTSMLLSGLGWNEDEVDVLIGRFGESTYTLIKENPYVAARVPQIGFVKADELAISMGISPEDRRRIDGAVLHTLTRHAADGSTCSSVAAICRDLPDGIFGTRPPEEKEEICADYLRLHGHELGGYQAITMPGGEIVCTTMEAARAAARSTKIVCDMLRDGRRHSLSAVDEACRKVLAPGGRYERLDDVQRVAVRMAATEPFCLLGGGPGVGKTTVMEAVADVLEELGEKSIMLAAPFGKASKRLGEATGRQATTVHRLLGAEGVVDGRAVFRHNAGNPLAAGCCIIIDETSTQDEAVWTALLDALPADGRIIFVGDPEQLPSVGPGAVLRDMIKASTLNGGIPMTYLTEVYRSGKDSGIALGAAEISDGRVPVITERGENGVSFRECDQNSITRLVVEEVRRMQAAGLDPIKDLAVLCPQAPGPAGTWELNTALSRLLNPDRKPITGVTHGPFDNRKMPVPHTGDRVMLTENETKSNLMNGDIGTIVAEKRMPDGKPGFTVLFDDGVRKDYHSRSWRSLILAYAGTIHKYQGSQAHTVIMPVCEAHSRMLDRPILYTGWTRAQRRLTLIGSREAFRQSVLRGQRIERETMLERILPRHVSTLAQTLKSNLNWNRLAKDAQDTVSERRRPPESQKSIPETGPASPSPPPGRLSLTLKKPVVASDGEAPGRRTGLRLTPRTENSPAIPEAVRQEDQASAPGGRMRLTRRSPEEVPRPTF